MLRGERIDYGCAGMNIRSLATIQSVASSVFPEIF